MAISVPEWLTEGVRSAMGAWPDHHVAWVYGKSRRTITRWRNRLGIESNLIRERGRREVLVPHIEAQVERWQPRFHVLHGWDIRVRHDPMADCKLASVDAEARTATILTCRGLPTDECDEHGVPRDYVLHELLHVALAAAQALDPKEGEEVLVQDLTWMLINGVGEPNRPDGG